MQAKSVAPKIISGLGWLAVICVSAVMLFQFDNDTTDVSGAAFVAVSVLSAVAFTYASVLSDESDKDDVVLAGERLCQGAMIFLGASLLKYEIIALPAQLKRVGSLTDTPAYATGSNQILVIGLEVMLYLVFLSGLLVSQHGCKVLGRVLTKRLSRRGKDVYFDLQ